MPLSDPLLACIAELADHFGLAFSPTLLLTVARDPSGQLPFHQAGSALELVGLNFEAIEGKKLTHQSDTCPAIVEPQK